MSNSLESKWFALHVRSRHEKSVCEQLHAKRQEAFLPLYWVENKWADRLKKVSLPLFPGYVFCRFEDRSRTAVLSTSGVIDLVRTGSEPAAIEESEIEAVQLIVNSSVRTEPFSQLVKGQRVTMIEGPLSGLTGTLTTVRNTLRLVVSVDLLCRSVLVEIDRAWVVPADTPNPRYTHSLSSY